MFIVSAAAVGYCSYNGKWLGQSKRGNSWRNFFALFLCFCLLVSGVMLQLGLRRGDVSATTNPGAEIVKEELEKASSELEKLSEGNWQMRQNKEALDLVMNELQFTSIEKADDGTLKNLEELLQDNINARNKALDERDNKIKELANRAKELGNQWGVRFRELQQLRGDVEKRLNASHSTGSAQ